MDRASGFDDGRHDGGRDDGHADDGDAGIGEASTAAAIGTDERRMHVRAYNHWVSLLGGRAYPAIRDLDPETIVDFGAHSVLLDFTGGIENPAVRFLGAALRAECGLDAAIASIADVPSRSLLSRLTDHYLQIIANRAPIGFEAEFVASRGNNTLYRGILMPFSSDGGTIDFIYGVINWKELVDAKTQAGLDAEVDAAVRAAPRPQAAAGAWADGPSAGFGRDDVADAPASGATTATEIDSEAPPALIEQLSIARESAAAARAADTRSRAALYRALGRAHDFALAGADDPDGYRALLMEAGIAGQPRAPMTPVVKLVFGADYDKTRLTEFAAVLTHAGRMATPRGGLAALIEATPGGIKGLVNAARAARRPARARVPAVAFDARPALASVTLPEAATPGSYVVLLARADAAGRFDIVASVADEALTARIARAASR